MGAAARTPETLDDERDLAEGVEGKLSQPLAADSSEPSYSQHQPAPTAAGGEGGGGAAADQCRGTFCGGVLGPADEQRLLVEHWTLGRPSRLPNEWARESGPRGESTPTFLWCC